MHTHHMLIHLMKKFSICKVSGSMLMKQVNDYAIGIVIKSCVMRETRFRHFLPNRKSFQFGFF